MKHKFHILFCGLCLFLFSCDDAKEIPEKVDNDSIITKSQSASESKLEAEVKPSSQSEETKQEILIPKKKPDYSKYGKYRGSMSPMKLNGLLPGSFRDFEKKNPSLSRIEKDGMSVTLAKGQYFNEKLKTLVRVDIFDCSPEKKVEKPMIYEKLPELMNFETKKYEIENGKGYFTWNPVKKMGWVDVLIHGRYIVKIVAEGENAEPEMCFEMLKQIDFSAFKDGKLFNSNNNKSEKK